MTKNEKLKEIIDTMNTYGITLHDLADEFNEQIWVWSVDDVKIRITERNDKYDIKMTDDEINNIAQEVIDRLDFSDYGDLYDTMDYVFDYLIEDVMEEHNNKGE
jgi:hypothetical protein